MTYRIGRSESARGTVFGLSGEMNHEHAERLEELLTMETHGPILLDLREVTLVARDAVRFLVRAEALGTRIVNCPEYVRSWIDAEKGARMGWPV